MARVPVVTPTVTGMTSPALISVVPVRTHRFAFGEVDRLRMADVPTRLAVTVGAAEVPPRTKSREAFPFEATATESNRVPSVNPVTEPLIVPCPLIVTGADEAPIALATLTLP